jgi:hypothetical protein
MGLRKNLIMWKARGARLEGRAALIQQTAGLRRLAVTRLRRPLQGAADIATNFAKFTGYYTRLGKRSGCGTPELWCRDAISAGILL